MAITRTDRGTKSQIGILSNRDLTCNSFTPAAGSLLVVPAGLIINELASAATLAALDTFGDSGGTSWSQLTIAGDGPAGYATRSSIFYRLVGTGPSAGTITVRRAAGADDQGYAVEYLEYAGHDTTTPIRSTASGESSATTLTINLNNSPLSTSEVVGLCTSENGTGITKGANYTQIVKNVFPGWDSGFLVQRNTSTPQQSVDWSGLDTKTHGNQGVAIEIAAAAAGGGSKLLSMLNNQGGF